MESKIKAAIDRLKSAGLKGEMDWEIDYFELDYFLEDEDGKIVKPLLMVVAHPESFFAIDSHLIAPSGKYLEDFLSRLLKILEEKEKEFYPARILVKKKDLYDFLTKFLEDLNIEIEMVKRTLAVESFKRESNKYFKHG